MRLWLVRHGETDANVAGVFCGHAPAVLTARGTEQARTLNSLLQGITFDQVFCSELERARHTARLVLAGAEVPIEITSLLNEMFFGDWEMRHHRDLAEEDVENWAAWCADWENTVPPGGEGFQEFSARVGEFIATLARLPERENVLIVSHQGVLSLLIALLLKMPAAALWHFHLDQGCWSRIELTDDFATLQVLNSRASA